METKIMSGMHVTRRSLIRIFRQQLHFLQRTQAPTRSLEKRNIQVAQKSKPIPNDQKIVLNRIKACQ